MKNITSFIIGSGLLALFGCSAAPVQEERTSSTSQAATTCVDTPPPNGSNCASAVAYGWCGLDWMAGTCAVSCNLCAPVGGVSSACLTNSGKNSAKAALAVAMAMELGRWDPMNDLIKGTESSNPKAKPKCTSSACPKTTAILGQQYFSADTAFSATGFASDLNQAFGRQINMDNSVPVANRPVAHKLTKVAGPTSIGTGACGAHYVFQADHLDGTPLTATEATNLQERLCWYGMDSNGHGCGNNKWISFVSGTLAGCPSGRQCVAIDPDWNDGGTPPTTTAGAIPQYPGNRYYDPNNTTLGTQCQKYNSNPAILGTMQSKCATFPTTCGYLYCT